MTSEKTIQSKNEGDLKNGRIRTKLKFSKSESTGFWAGFVSRNSKTNEMRGVRADSQYPKKICLVDKALSHAIFDNVLYDCVIIPMAEKNGYVVIQAEPVQFKATIRTTYEPHSAYIVEVKFGNQSIRFDPYNGRKESINDLSACRRVLEKRVDIRNLAEVVEDFVKAGNDLLAQMEEDGARRKRWAK